MSDEQPAVLVTGGASGIGLATCELLRDQGHRVIAGDIAGDCDVSLDVTDEDAWDRVFAQIGVVDRLVNCAGIRTIRPIQDMSREEFMQVIDVNLVGPFLGTRALVRHLLAADRPGSIVNVASGNGLSSPVPNQCHYGASKAGLILLTKASAVELGPAGIRVNAVAPGAIDTPLVRPRLQDPAFVSRIIDTVPIGRIGEPHEVAELIAFLLSDAASFMTGSIVSVDGGFHAK
jgi:NAD(P)-dependent dehydrogenase (short-subunit alcohol dehydrogenase family)